jgi:LmbE family N-acetylglucosaminyl deacetylase
MTASSEAARGSPVALVVAHPDDEALWLSSALARADRIVFCFGDPFARPRLSGARRRAVAALPLSGKIDLGVPESGSRFLADWAHPRPTPAGIEITDGEARVRYEANYPKLVDALRTSLAGCGEVYTHNPWGEYGHTEHIQVHRAVAALQDELGYTVWFPNYVGAMSWKLACRCSEQPCWSERRMVSPAFATAQRLMRLYRRHHAWTWTRWHRWPEHETLYAQPPRESPVARSPLRGEWLLDVAGLRWWPPPWHPAAKRLPER